MAIDPQSEELNDAEVGESLHATGNGSPSVKNGSNGQYARLASLLEDFKGKSHLVVLQGSPDPDAISSALALEFLGVNYEIETTIFCSASLSHSENKALVKSLGINLVAGDKTFDVSSFDMYSIVDSQKSHTILDASLQKHGVQFFAFVDHHREDAANPPAMFVDIRQNVRSTAAIFCEYLKQEFPKGLEPSDDNHVKIATALMHGMRTDTDRFTRASSHEYIAADFLAPCVDQQVIELIERKVLSSGVLGMLENALVRRRSHDNFMISDVGYVRASDRDGIPQAAELLLAREGTDTVLVFGIVDEKAIDGSFRTRSQTINPDEFLKELLGVNPESGRHYGGGNVHDSGGFQIPLGFIGRYEDKEQVYSMASEIIEKAFLAHIGKQEGEADSEATPKPRQRQKTGNPTVV